MTNHTQICKGKKKNVRDDRESLGLIINSNNNN